MKIKADLVQRLRERGGRLTPQRRLVLEILEESAGHPDAEAIFEEARRREASIGLATVYRSLALLKSAGLIEEHRLGEDHGHFETIHKTRHYHFTCLECGRVIELASEALDTAVRALGEGEGLEVTEVSLDLGGICGRCRERIERG